jgi:putative FmdB family regulatory protein
LLFWTEFEYIPLDMPTYDYECRSCSHSFETFQSMSDESLTDCPECGKEQLRRLIGGGSAIIFKGSGFYVNDSRKESSPEGSSSTSSDKAAPKKADTSGGKATA